MSTRSLFCSIGVCLSLLTSQAHGYLYSAVYAFGDSLSDNGASLTVKAPDTPPARASNGSVAPEIVAAALGAPLFDYAVGGAKTDTTNSDYPIAGDPLANTGVLSQITAFHSDHPDIPNLSLALYLVSGGSNDVLEAAGSLDLTNVDIATAFVSTLVSNFNAAVQQLYDLGGRHFLLSLLPDLGLTPEAVGLGLAADLSDLSVWINSELLDSFPTLFADKPDSSYAVSDTLSVQRAVVSDPAAFGLTNVTDPCVSPDDGSVCINPDSYLFWDTLHPTSAASAILAANMLTALPEPSSIALAGLGLLMLRHRKTLIRR